MGVRFGEYETESELARGGYGTVFVARHARLRDRRVALKVLATRDPRDVERLVREAEALARLAHPNVVAIHDAGFDEDGRPFIVLELVEGTTFGARLAAGATRAELLSWLADAARGVAHAHELGIVHRDLKPDNILVTATGAKVCDFGIARQLDRKTILTETGAVLGTIAYMAPEQARGEPVGPQGDVFSLGALLYEVLAERPPFEADNPLALIVAVSEARIERPSRVARQPVPPALEAACLHALEADPAWRPRDARAFLAELEAALRAPGGPALPRVAMPALACGALAVLAAVALVVRARAPATAPDGAPPRTPPVADVRADSAKRPAPPANVAARREPAWYVSLLSESAERPPRWFEELAPSAKPASLPSGLRFLPRRGEYLNVKDGSVLVWIAAPRPFFFGRREVATQQFERFVDLEPGSAPLGNGSVGFVTVPTATWRHPAGGAALALPERPVTQVSFDDAVAYCDWAGLALPTSELWRVAAGGDESAPPGWARWDPVKRVLAIGPFEMAGVARPDAPDIMGAPGARRAKADADSELAEWCADDVTDPPAHHAWMKAWVVSAFDGVNLRSGKSLGTAKTDGLGFRVSRLP